MNETEQGEFVSHQLVGHQSGMENQSIGHSAMNTRHVIFDGYAIRAHAERLALGGSPFQQVPVDHP